MPLRTCRRFKTVFMVGNLRIAEWRGVGYGTNATG
jgi:hypothetical protein